jgi:hypothetical protein
MPTWTDVIRIARGLPDVSVSTWHRTPALKVAGKSFARLRTEAEGGLVVLCSQEEKERLLESGEPAYYTTPHYDGYGAILVDLSVVGRDALQELVTRSWYMKAPSRLRALVDWQRSLPPPPSGRRTPRAPPGSHRGRRV